MSPLSHKGSESIKIMITAIVVARAALINKFSNLLMYLLTICILLMVESCEIDSKITGVWLKYSYFEPCYIYYIFDGIKCCDIGFNNHN